MKLYNEKQVKKAIELAQEMDKVPYTDNDYTHRHNEQNIIESLTPIELPSDEEIEIRGNEFSDRTSYSECFKEGAEWVIEQIKKQEK